MKAKQRNASLSHIRRAQLMQCGAPVRAVRRLERSLHTHTVINIALYRCTRALTSCRWAIQWLTSQMLVTGCLVYGSSG